MLIPCGLAVVGIVQCIVQDERVRPLLLQFSSVERIPPTAAPSNVAFSHYKPDSKKARSALWVEDATSRHQSKRNVFES